MKRKNYRIIEALPFDTIRPKFHGKTEGALLKHDGKLCVLHCWCDEVSSKYSGNLENNIYGTLVCTDGLNPECEDCSLYAGIVEPQGSVVQKNILIQHSV